LDQDWKINSLKIYVPLKYGHCVLFSVNGLVLLTYYITNNTVVLCLFTMSTQPHFDSFLAFLEDSSSESSSDSQTKSNASLFRTFVAFIGSSPSRLGKPLENDNSSTDSSSHSRSDTNGAHLKVLRSSPSFSSTADTFSEDESENHDSDYFESPHPTGVHSDISDNLPSEWQLPSTYNVLESSSEKHNPHHLSIAYLLISCFRTVSVLSQLLAASSS
jgi:hypothetical protein